jgi:ATP-dependent RNA helicase DeaD
MSDKTEHPPVPEAFAALGVRPSILRALAEAKFVTPSEIQSLLIPRALAGVDILGQARTGTGKTAAFGIPILQRATKGLATQAIILVPTRELAVQVDTEIKRLGEFTPIRTCAVYGGQKIAAQMKHLKHGPEILIGTPGRVIDLLDRRIIRFDNIRFVVLDEVDRMLDIGFRDDIRNILSRVKGVKRGLPPDARQQGVRRGRQREGG